MIKEEDEDGVLNRRGVFNEIHRLIGGKPTYMELMRLYVETRINASRYFRSLNWLVRAREYIADFEGDLITEEDAVSFLDEVDEVLWEAGFDQDPWNDWESSLGPELLAGRIHDTEKDN